MPQLATDLEGMLNKTMMDKLLMVPVHKPDQLDSSTQSGSSPVTGYAFHATGDGSITVSTNDVTRASGYAMGYADPEKPPPPLPQRLCLYCSSVNRINHLGRIYLYWCWILPAYITIELTFSALSSLRFQLLFFRKRKGFLNCIGSSAWTTSYSRFYTGGFN